MEKTYYVYIVTNFLRTVLYIGVTNDLLRRIHEHREGRADSFTSKYKVHKLIYYEQTSDVLSAIEREKILKGWKREKKILLIESDNPQWKDLIEDPSLLSG